MFAGKPIIGIVGGIGSGKTFVARLFGELGCLVIESDEQVRQAYLSPEVRNQLREWWGSGAFLPDGAVNRAAIARKVFSDPQQRKRLEGLLHPLVSRARQQVMEANGTSAQVLAFVWDTPLLVETGLDRQCDVVVFVDAPVDARLARVSQRRGWSQADLTAREKLQAPLDTKREISDYMVGNTAGANEVRAQVRDVLSRILSDSAPTV